MHDEFRKHEQFNSGPLEKARTMCEHYESVFSTLLSLSHKLTQFSKSIQKKIMKTMKLAITTTLVAFIFCLLSSVGATTADANTPSADDAPKSTAELAELAKPDNANLRGGRELSSFCYWKGKQYGHSKWAYDCNAKYDKCQCICDWSSGDCEWKNCRNDHDYCGGWGGGQVEWKKYKHHACRKYGTNTGKKNVDYHKYDNKSFDWCKEKCADNDWCRAFEYDKYKNNCEIWKTYPKDEEPKHGLYCYKKK